jgi:hypothetical protein
VYSPNDRVPFKPSPEVMLVGHAFAPRGEPVSHLYARLLVGNVDKSIEVFADETVTVDGGRREGPRFTKMPLRWERAAGGPDTQNPVGVRGDVVNALGAVALPNLRIPGTILGNRGDYIEPTGFGPIAPSWPARLERIARLGRAWTGADPDEPLPDALDPTYFLAAPRDQMLTTLRSDERLVLENLHAEHPRLVTNLSGTEPRVFIDTPQHPPWELKLKCDTLWIDTDRSIATLTWRGQAKSDGRGQPGRVIVAMEKAGKALAWPSVEASLRSRGRASMSPSAILASPTTEDTANGMSAPPEPDLETGPLSGSRGPSAPAWLERSGVLKPPTVPPPAAPVSAPTSPPRPASVPAPHVPTIRRPTQVIPDIATAGARDRDDAAIPFKPAASPAHEPPWLQRADPSPRAPSTARVPVVPAPATQPAAAPRRPTSPPIAPPPIAPPPIVPPPALVTAAIAPPIAVPAASAWAVQEQRVPSVTVGQMVVGADAPRPANGATLGQSLARAPAPASDPKKPADVADAARRGSAAASDAAAQAAPKVAPRKDDAPDAVAPSDPARTVPQEHVHLVWFDPLAVPKIRALAPKASTQAATTWIKGDAPKPEDREVVDRRDVLRAISSGRWLDEAGLGDVVTSAFREDGSFEPPVALVSGELCFSFDEVETLRATVTVATPFTSADKKLRDAVNAASEALKSELPGDVLEGLRAGVEDAFTHAARAVAPGYLATSTERILLEARRFQKKTLFGAPHIRALLTLAGGRDAMPAYLPEPVGAGLPLFRRLRVRAVVEVHPQEDQYETHRDALRVLALGRTLRERRAS